MKRRTQKVERFCAKIDTFRLKYEQYRLWSGLSFISSLIIASLLERNEFIFLVALLFTAFVACIAIHRKLKFRLQYAEALLAFYKRQELRGQGLYDNSDPYTPVYKNSLEERLSTDLDLFGNHSVFEFIDETVTEEGKEELGQRLLSAPLPSTKIELLHQSIKKLSSYKWRLLRLTLLAQSNDKSLQLRALQKALNQPIDSARESKVFALNVFAFATAIATTFFVLNGSIALPLLLPIALFAVVSFSSLGGVQPKFKMAMSIAEDASQLQVLFNEIENKLTYKPLSFLFAKTITQSPSKKIKQLNRILSLMSVQGHPLVHLVVNAILPWDQTLNWLYERWRLRFAKNFDAFLGELTEFEIISCAVYLNTYHKTSLPNVKSDNKVSMGGTEIRHPLIDQKNVVSNSFDLGKDFHMGLITGSNMAGKSTFLRTLGVNHILATMGYPVFANSFETTALPIRTSLRITDSLEDGFSSFYTEAKVISEMVVAAKSGEPFFYLIDEIFRGTNNKERFSGSLAVIKSFAHSNQCAGLISSHDLELATFIDSIPGASNWHFSEKINGSEMSFSYKVTPGPCKSTNALVILRQLGLELPDKNQ